MYCLFCNLPSEPFVFIWASAKSLFKLLQSNGLSFSIFSSWPDIVQIILLWHNAQHPGQWTHSIQLNFALEEGKGKGRDRWGKKNEGGKFQLVGLTPTVVGLEVPVKSDIIITYYKVICVNIGLQKDGTGQHGF